MIISDLEETVITNLVDVCKDGRDFYLTAAKKVDDEELENIFLDNANTRSAIIDDLKGYITKIGRPIVADGTVTGKAASFFGKIKASLSTDKNETLATELEEAEDRSLNEFNEAMKEKITPELKQLIAKHKQALENTHFKMKSLKNALKAA